MVITGVHEAGLRKLTAVVFGIIIFEENFIEIFLKKIYFLDFEEKFTFLEINFRFIYRLMFKLLNGSSFFFRNFSRMCFGQTNFERGASKGS